MEKRKKSSPDKNLKGKEEKKPKEELKECQELKNEYLAGWQRERADFINYKKGELERVGGLLKYADTGLVLKFLTILDSFELAGEKLPKELKEDESVKGLLQIKAQVTDFLKAYGVEEIESLGKQFDPHLQEVVEVVEMKDKESGTVIKEVQKGYKIHGRILRPAKVKVIK